MIIAVKYTLQGMDFAVIDESGTVHDNDFDNKELISWEKTILDELAILY